MKFKERAKNIGFWVSLACAAALVASAFGAELGGEAVSIIVKAICSALVVFGIISDPTSGKGYLDAAGLDIEEAISAAKSVASAIKENSENKDK